MSEITPLAAEAATNQGTSEGGIPDSVLEALAGTPKPPDSGDADGQQTAGTPPATLNDLAQANGLDLDALYSATVSLPDEQGTATLEELKNQATAFRKSEAERAQLSQDQTDFANRKLTALQELNSLLNAIPADKVDEDLRQAIGQQRQAFREQQDRLILEVIPDWSDNAKKAADREGMAAMMAEYGLPAGALDQIIDAGAQKMVYDYWKLKTRLAAIMGKRGSQGTTATKRTPVASTAATDRANATAKAGDSIGAIAQLIGG